MFLRHFQISNYKTFDYSNPIIFAPGINIIVGKNNSGKTSLLDAMGLRIDNTPNICLQQDNQLTESQDKKASSITATFCLSGKEILDIILNKDNHKRFSEIKLSSEAAKIAVELDSRTYQDKTTELVKYLLQDTPSIYFHFKLPEKDFFHTWQEISYDFMDFNFLLPLPLPKSPSVKEEDKKEIEKDDENDLDPFDIFGSSIPKEELSTSGLLEFVINDAHHLIRDYITNTYVSKSYRFRAERLIQDSVEITKQSETVLKPDASNLAGFLHYLQGSRPDILREVNVCLEFVLPEIKELSVRQNEKKYEIAVWFHCLPGNPREFKLSQCGSGVGQVVAILCVVIAMKRGVNHRFGHSGRTACFLSKM